MKTRPNQSGAAKLGPQLLELFLIQFNNLNLQVTLFNIIDFL